MSELTKYNDEYGAIPSYPMFGVTSFAELEEIQGVYDAAERVERMADHFCMIASNIAIDEAIEDKQAALKALAKEFAARVNAAVAKTKERQGLLATVRRMLKRKPETVETEPETIVDATPEPAIDTNKSFNLWKTKEGGYRWMAIYSNQFRDNDNPPEILSEKAHKTFVAMVDAGLVDYPDLWHWHIPGTVWGKADWLAYDNGFALASGYVLPGHEKEAELVSQMADVRVSHGMPSRHIVRSKEDQSIIDMYVSVEISPLPGWAAANKLTDFVMLNKEYEMLSPEKRDYLSKAGLDEATISQIEAQLSEKSKAAKDAGIEAKETATEQPVTEQPAVVYATQQEVASAFSETMKILGNIQTALNSVQAEVKSLKASDEQKVAEKAAGTPRASLADLIAQSFGEEARIDGRSTLGKAGPKQAPTTESVTGLSYIDQMIATSRNGGAQ